MLASISLRMHLHLHKKIPLLLPLLLPTQSPPTLKASDWGAVMDLVETSCT